MRGKTFLTTVDIALIGVFCALWVILNLTLGPLGFAWFGLPIFCDFAVFFSILLATWATGKFGAASLVGIIGASITLMIRATPFIIGFAASAILFDILMTLSRHKISTKPYNLSITALATLLSAYFAGITIGIYFTNNTVEWALTFWGPWHLAGGIMTLIITVPIIGMLEKANVRKIKNA